MGKNMNLIPSLFLLNKHKELWLWPSCKHPKTRSFRLTTRDSSMSIHPNKESLPEADVELTTPDSCFTNSSESASISTESEKYFDNNECSSSSVETIVRGARSERLFFQPDATSSILETQGSGRQCTRVETGGGLPYKESVVMEMESDNPYGDFKKSMEEMVESHGLKDWDCLEELLRWYLRMNGKNNHEVIVGAFVDLLSGISGGGGSDHSTATFTSAASTFSSSSPSSDQIDRDKIKKEGKTVTK
ncbi:transcription repressor OFP13-like [Cynara cardunculus var. scolymus]|uniref:Transcription repressor n=1 Tax=Cynara cardunculus var. scolymus TaxID=59895 RepID=A0A103YID1_CYNCS|nr:transcription repressor OFP13-like [Cynara cardunculus var. scolymus]KVI09639.1 Ovate protein family, C-terminal [Cynara cardunculus var. scolymus]